MTSKLPSLKGLPVSFLQQPTSGRHCRTAQLSPIAQSKKCQKFPPETEEGVFVGFSLFLLLAGSTGSIKLSKMPRPPHQQEALSRPRHWATERERGSKWRAPGTQVSLCLRPLHPVGTAPGRGEGSWRGWEESVCLCSCSWNYGSHGKSQSPVLQLS